MARWCGYCGRELPAGKSAGRPREYCNPGCRRQAETARDKYLREVGRVALAAVESMKAPR